MFVFYLIVLVFTSKVTNNTKYAPNHLCQLLRLCGNISPRRLLPLFAAYLFLTVFSTSTASFCIWCFCIWCFCFADCFLFPSFFQAVQKTKARNSVNCTPQFLTTIHQSQPATKHHLASQINMLEMNQIHFKYGLFERAHMSFMTKMRHSRLS